MKKSLLWIVLLGITVVFNACDKGSDPVPPIVGTWARNSYEFTELPTGFTKYWEGYTETSFGESNYILTFNADGTYSRKFTLPSPYNLNDTGKWTLDGTKLKLTPSSASDIDLIEYLGFPGSEFTVVGDISEVRLTMNRVLTLSLYPDTVLDEANTSGENPPADSDEPVDVTIVYKFDKVK